MIEIGDTAPRPQHITSTAVGLLGNVIKALNDPMNCSTCEHCQWGDYCALNDHGLERHEHFCADWEARK